MDNPFDVNEDKAWKHDSKFVEIIKNMYCTWFMLNISKAID